MRQIRNALLFRPVLFLGVALILNACSAVGGNSPQLANSKSETGFAADKPINLLAGSSDTATPATRQASIRVGLNSKSLNRAIRNYQIRKQMPAGPFHTVGADLNSDGKGEGLVLFTGEKWCAPDGCTLVIFGAAGHGYRAISSIKRVKAPVKVSRHMKSGWYGLLVKTGAGVYEQTVELPFNGRGYPGNATLMKKIPYGSGHDAEILLPASANPIAAQPSDAKIAKAVIQPLVKKPAAISANTRP